MENQNIEYKSLNIITGGKHKKLAEECVGFANAQGEKKGTAFIINPKLLSDSKLNIKPTLKTIEPHRLKALIVEDLQIHPRSKSSEIQERIHDISIEEIRRILLSMEKAKTILSEGSKRYKVYVLA